MQSFIQIIKQQCVVAIQQVYNVAIDAQQITVNETKPEFTGDYTIVTFSLSKILGKKPADIAQELGQELSKNKELFSAYNVIQGFLNISLQEKLLLTFLQKEITKLPTHANRVIVEYASPNTNKPLHFGHLRNIFLGDSMCKILEACGNTVVKANLINDRGIHICKSMYAWMQYANGATPQSTQTKGDHFVGEYYVRFETELKKETALLLAEIDNNNFTNIHPNQVENIQKLQALRQAESNADKQKELTAKIVDIAKANTASMKGATALLLKWEENDTATKEIWRTMNDWVYQGFDATFASMGVSFDKYYYESETYLLGKEIVQEGLAKNTLFTKEDNSVWIDLTADGLDQKLLQRGNGTSVYMTQDLGTARLKYNDYTINTSVYVIADEQNYHMQVLKLILQKLHEPCADGIYHLSYGMVELPNGRMKSREGTVVDADDMIAEMKNVAMQKTQEHGKVKDFTPSELTELYNTLGLGALKFYLLRVDPKKKMIFNPEESIDFQGFTGSFIQYVHARICSILAKEMPQPNYICTETLLPHERKIALLLEQYPSILLQSASEYNPSVLCNYVFELAKNFNSLIAELKVLTAETVDKKQLRLQICVKTKNTIFTILQLLGIQSPNKM